MARHGENLRRRQDGRWEGRYQAFDAAKGKYRSRSVYGRDYAEAKEKLSRAKLGLDSRDAQGGHAQEGERCRGKETDAAGKGALSDCRTDGSCDMSENSGNDAGHDGRIRFSQAAGEWLEQIRGTRKYSTYTKYSSVYQTHLAGAVGPFLLCADTAQELREKISDHLSGNVMSESLQKSIVCVANQILTFANTRYSSGVPRLEAPAGKAKKPAAGSFSRAEQAQLLGCVDQGVDQCRVGVRLCLYAGLRLGEVCALRWEDIDFGGMALTVARTVQRVAMPGYPTKTILLETEPKSADSARTIPLPPELLELLSRLKEEEQEKRNKRNKRDEGDKKDEEEAPYVFGGKKPLEPRTMQYWFRKLLKEAGVEARNFHTLRHTFATNCVESGMDVKTLSEILGHSDVRITLNRYVHPTMDSKRKQLGALAEFYGQIYGQAA